MGVKRTIRTLATMQNRSFHKSRQKHNELLRQQKSLESLTALHEASYEVQSYENYLDALSSIHKEGSEPWDWKAIQETEAPIKPILKTTHERNARETLDAYKPGMVDKLFKRAETKKDDLTKAVEAGNKLDRQEYEEAMQVYEQEFAEWEADCLLAGKVLAKDLEAYKAVLTQISSFNELVNGLGTSIHFFYENGSLMEVQFKVRSEEVIPRETKSLLKSGKVSVKEMPKTRFYEIYQDYICGCVLRIARELFALLPLETVIITATGDILNTQTGYKEEKPILSVLIPRVTFQQLNLASLDPSDSMSNFIHRMNFKKNTGFSAIERILPSDLDVGSSSEGREIVNR